MTLFKPDAILFDFDDTLVSSQSLISQALEQTLIKFGLVDDSTTDEVRTWYIDSVVDNFNTFFKNKALEATNFYRQQYAEFSKSGLQPMAGANDTLKYLAQLPNQPYIGLVSNKLGNTLRQEVKQLGWDKYFRTIVGFGDVNYDEASKKPAVDPLKLALVNSGGLTPATAHIWFIGDSPIDMEAAHNFNCHSILIRETYDATLFATYPPKLHVNQHVDLLRLIQSFY